MKKWKWLLFCLGILSCLALNTGGRMLAVSRGWYFWLDSLGTALCAFFAGPWCGAMVGVTSSLVCSMMYQGSPLYALAGAAIGIIIGYAARRKTLETFFGFLLTALLVTLATLTISVTLNFIFFGGQTNNPGGDNVILYLTEHGFPHEFACLLGQFYVEFPDKLITMVLLFFIVLIVRSISDRFKKPEENTILNGSSGGGAAALLLALCLLASPHVCARTEEAGETSNDYNSYVQTIYGSRNGLPCGEANDIAQTNDGILWIGTYAGLYRYNGSEFRWMNEYDSVRNVNCLYVDEEGRLWIGTNDNGLSISINESIANVVDTSSGLPSNSVRSIIQGSDGYYYIGTTGSMQVMTLNSGLRQVTTLREINFADCITADSLGHVAATTSDGRLFLLRKGQILSSRQLPGGSESFRCCAFNADGELLAGTTGNAIHIFDISGDCFEEKRVVTCPELQSLKDLYLTDKGEIFISSDTGIGYLDARETFRPINTNGFNASIDNMLLDYQGNLWFTSSRLGLLRMAPSSFHDIYATLGMDSQVVNTIARWQGSLFFGTDKGLDAVTGDCRAQVRNSLTLRLEDTRIRCMLPDSRGSLWICTYGSGLLEVSPDGSEYLYNRDNGSFGNRARLVYELQDGTILAGGDTGISYIRDHEVVRTIGYADGLINSMILTFTELPDGRILAGTDGDGIAVLENGKVTRMLTREDGLSSEVILRTVADPKGEGVFIVTSNGLCFLSLDGSIRTLDNFPYFNNYNIYVRDEDTLFVLSSAGIYVVDRDELLSGTEPLTYDLLDSKQGLSSALTANSWVWDDGNNDLYLACDSGVFLINTINYSAGAPSYRMLIPEIRLDNKIVRPDRGTEFVVGRNVARIELLPEIINYSIQNPLVGYYLEGFDTGWTTLPQSSLGAIAYTNLPSGSYTFHLAVFDNTGKSVLAQRTYTLTKENADCDRPFFPFYIVGVLLLFVASLTGVLFYSSNRKKDLKLAQARETVQAIAQAVDAKDERTRAHSDRVAEYSVLIARKLGYNKKQLENLRHAAQLHDIGKIAIPDNILNKTTRLDDKEYATMKTHTSRGAKILAHFTLIDHVAEGAEFHHERYDGRGYPKGLKGEEIPEYGRIIGVADAFDAMSATRVYRKQMNFDYVINEIRKGRGTQFDPKMVDIFLKLIEDGEIDIDKIYSKKEEETEEKPEKENAGEESPKEKETGAGETPKEKSAGEAPAEGKGDEA